MKDISNRITEKSLGLGLSVSAIQIKKILELIVSDKVVAKNINWVQVSLDLFSDSIFSNFDLPEQLSLVGPTSLHLSTLSLGSPDEIDPELFTAIKKEANRFNSFLVSDSLGFRKINGYDFQFNTPIVYSKDALNQIVSRIKMLQSKIERPFAIENCAAYFAMPGSQMTEAEFISELVSKCDCYLLLDLSSLLATIFNCRSDKDLNSALEAAFSFLQQIPIHRVKQIRISAFKKYNNRNVELLVKSIGPIQQEMLLLLKEFLRLGVQKNILLNSEGNAMTLVNNISSLVALEASQ